jgi:hypothetical protein
MFKNVIFIIIIIIIIFFLILLGILDSLVSIATGYGTDNRGVGVQVQIVKNFLSSTSSRPDLRPTQPPIQWVPEALSPWVKRQGAWSWLFTSN